MKESIRISKNAAYLKSSYFQNKKKVNKLIYIFFVTKFSKKIGSKAIP